MERLAYFQGNFRQNQGELAALQISDYITLENSHANGTNKQRTKKCNWNATAYKYNAQIHGAA